MTKFNDLTTLEKTKQWNMVAKARGKFNRTRRKFKVNVKINEVYLLDGKESARRIKNDRAREIMSRRVVGALYDQNTNDFYLDVYDIIGDEGTTIHELAHAFDYQNGMVSMKKSFVGAFLRDKMNWHENSIISGKRAEKPYEFFADFVSLYLINKQEAIERFPNYYKVFKSKFGAW